MRLRGRGSQREEEAHGEHVLYAFIWLHRPSERTLVYPLVKKLLKGYFLLFLFSSTHEYS